MSGALPILDPAPVRAGALPAEHVVPFLAGLDLETAHAVRSRLETLAVPGGRVLFEEGDAADGLFTLVSGAIGISTRDPATGCVRRIARLRPPETVGEVALLSDSPRSATATVLRDSLLLRLTRESFDDLVMRHPAAMLYFARLLADRLRSTERSRAQAQIPLTFAVLAVTRGVSAEGFAHALCGALEGRSGHLYAWPAGADETWFHTYESRNERVVYAAGELGTPWSNLCLRRADQVLLLACPGEPLAPGWDTISSLTTSDWTRRDLVVVQTDDAVRPQPVHPSVDALASSMRHQVRMGRWSDLCRIARLVSGRAKGLVLGGGGARGLAHLGVLRALEEAGHPVDFVAGTSIGAVVAASVAMGWSLDQIRRNTVASFVSSNPLNDYTLPVMSLTRGTKVDMRLRQHFGGARIEDLWLPFFCVSSNLTTGDAMVHGRGDLSLALRASIAIPGLLPPVLSPDGVLVDGAMMNNLPADLMAAQERGPVLAVDVAGDLAFQSMPRRSWRGRVLRRMLGAPNEMPGIAQLLLRAATVSSDASAAMAREKAAVVLRPPLAGVDLRDWSAYASVADIGYRHAIERMAEGGLEAWTG